MKSNAAYDRLQFELEALQAKLNTPEICDFREGVLLEACHQRQKWPEEHDKLKTPTDWFWTLGYLAGKALAAGIAGDREKLKHHIITSAALLANWHRQVLAEDVAALNAAAPVKYFGCSLCKHFVGEQGGVWRHIVTGDEICAGAKPVELERDGDSFLPKGEAPSFVSSHPDERISCANCGRPIVRRLGDWGHIEGDGPVQIWRFQCADGVSLAAPPDPRPQ